MSAGTKTLPRRGSGDIAQLPPHELFSVALQGLRTRRLRAALSALGIAIGIGAMVAVVGVSASSQANLLTTIDKLGTNLLTVAPGTTFLGANEVLPGTAVPTIKHMAAVQTASAVYQVSGATIRRTKYVPPEQTGGIGVDATDAGLLAAVSGQMATGTSSPPPATTSRPLCSAPRPRAPSRSSTSAATSRCSSGGRCST